jgi:hypothetical protein
MSSMQLWWSQQGLLLKCSCALALALREVKLLMRKLLLWLAVSFST